MSESRAPVDLTKLAGVLDATSTIYVAISLRSGPHVTPELFTVSGGRIICLTSATTLKARRSRNGDDVGLCATSPSGTAILAGTVEILDPTSLSTLLGAPSAAVDAPLGVARFLRDNASEMMGAATDALLGRLGRPLPPHRVVLAFTPTAALTVEGSAVQDATGWDGADEGGGCERAAPHALDDGPEPVSVQLDDLPGALGDIAIRGPAVLGWRRASGTSIALPVEWDPEHLEATLPVSVMDVCGSVGSGPACVTFSEWTGYGPSGKRGVMLRGRGTVFGDGQTARIKMEVDRASYWDGIETGTIHGERLA